MNESLLDRETIERMCEITRAAPILVALSGGGDSTALLHLLTERFGARGLIALVVDHALRAGSARDAQAAAGLAGAAGVPHEVVTLDWPNGPRRSQAGARTARHRALCEAARRHGARVIALGHTADDQAETVFMRAASGSSWRGLAGMRAIAPAPAWPEGREIVAARPLLNARRAALRDLLRAEHRAWIEDPANQSRDFARVRARQRLAALEQAGFEPMRLAGLAARLRPYAAAVDAAAFALIERGARFEAGDVVIDLGAWRESAEARQRALGALIAAVAGAAETPRAEAIARLDARLESFSGATLGGARLRRRGLELRLSRDPGALAGRADGVSGVPDLDLPAHGEAVWDGRLVIKSSEPGWRICAASGAPLFVRNDGALTPDKYQTAGAGAFRWLIAENVAHRLGHVHRLATAPRP